MRNFKLVLNMAQGPTISLTFVTKSFFNHLIMPHIYWLEFFCQLIIAKVKAFVSQFITFFVKTKHDERTRATAVNQDG